MSGPYRERAQARLSWRGGLSRVALGGARPLAGLYRVGGDGPAPVVEVAGDELLVRPGRGRKPRAGLSRLTLDAERAWDISLAGGIHQLEADLALLALSSVAIDGGVHRATLTLGHPVGSCPVRLSGGVHDLSLVRPPGVGIRLELRGGAHQLAVDQFEFGAVAGPVRWESAGYGEGLERFEVQVRGGAHRLTIR